MGLLGSVSQGARSAWRALRSRSPILALGSVAFAVAVGISAASLDILAEMYSGAPPGVGEPDRVVVVPSVESYPAFVAAASSLSSGTLVAYSERKTVLEIGGELVALRIQCVTSKYFHALQVPMAYGTPFTDGDVQGLILARPQLRSVSTAGPRSIGQAARIGGEPTMIRAIAGNGFKGVSSYDADAWVVLETYPELCGSGVDRRSNSNALWLRSLARLNQASTVAQLEAELRSSQSTSALQSSPQSTPLRTLSVAYRERLARSGRVVVALQFGALVLLAISCSNLMVLFSLRTSGREAEFAIRQCLGASRKNLAIMLMSEVALIGVACAAAAWLIAVNVHSGLSVYYDFGSSSWLASRRILLVLALAASGGLVVGLVPAIRLARSPLTLVQARSASSDRTRSFALAIMLGSQVAMAVAAMSIGDTFKNGLTALVRSAGYDVQSLVAVDLDPHRVRFRFDESLLELRTAHASNLGARMGEHKVALTSYAPLDNDAPRQFILLRPSTHAQPLMVSVNFISPKYFEVTGTEIPEGRPFNDSDLLSAGPVMIVDRASASALWRGGSPVGRCAFLMNQQRCVLVVGISVARRPQLLTEQLAEVFLPAPQAGLYDLDHPGRTILVRYDGTATSALKVIQSVPLPAPAVAAEYRLVGDLVAAQTVRWRFGSVAFGFFGIITSLLASLGVYSATALTVLRRRAELGVRTALGASRASLVGLVTKRAAWTAVIGSAGGTVLAGTVLGLIESLVGDLGTLTAGSVLRSTVVLALVAGLGAFVPAWRVARTSPSTTMASHS